MHTTWSRPQLVVSPDCHGVVDRAGSRLLAGLADATTLTSTFSEALGQVRPREPAFLTCPAERARCDRPRLIT